MIYRILISFFILSFSGNIFAQAEQQNPKLLKILAKGMVEIPADLIQFNLRVSVTQLTSRSAFENHRQKEKFLVSVLKKAGIEEKDIRFQPVSLNVLQQRNPETTRFTTMQQVVISFSDFELYESIQNVLVENDFSQFNAAFYSTKTTDAEKDALKKALSEAKAKAELIAGEMNLKIAGIHEIRYGDSSTPREFLTLRGASSSDSMVSEFNQTIPVSSSVEVVFILETLN